MTGPDRPRQLIVPGALSGRGWHVSGLREGLPAPAAGAGAGTAQETARLMASFGGRESGPRGDRAGPQGRRGERAGGVVGREDSAMCIGGWIVLSVG